MNFGLISPEQTFRLYYLGILIFWKFILLIDVADYKFDFNALSSNMNSKTYKNHTQMKCKIYNLHKVCIKDI